jgi:hypothetical protein
VAKSMEQGEFSGYEGFCNHRIAVNALYMG